MATINQPNLSSWEEKYAKNIEGLAKYNNVDLGVASDMLKSNLSGTGQYKGGGVLDFNVAKADYSNAINADGNRINQSGNYTGGTTSAPVAYQDQAASYYEKMLADAEEANRKALEAAQEAQRLRTEQAVNTNNAYIPQVNQQFAKQQQENYIASQLAKMNMPQNLAAMGMTGGASESAMLGLDTNYQNVRNTTDTERNSALDSIRNNEANIRATGDAGLADLATQYYNQYLSNVSNAQQLAQSQANWQAEFDATKQNNADQNAIDMAKLRASYGDYSGLKSLGITVTDQPAGAGKKAAGTGTDSSGEINQNKVDQILNGLGNYMAYPGTTARNENATRQVLNLYNIGSLSKQEANYILSRLGLPAIS